MNRQLTLALYAFPKLLLILLLFGMSLARAELKPTELTYFGMHIHYADQGTAWPPIRFGSWRLWDARVSWSRLQPRSDKWDFSILDRYMAMASITKTEVLLPLGLTPTWASARPTEVSHYEKGNASEPRNIALWQDYVRTVSERYKGKITHYEIWNEVNDPKFYSGTVEDLVKLTCEASRILKEVDPNNTLASPSVTEVGRHLKWHEDFLRLGGGACVDAMTHHFYATNGQPEGLVSKIRAVRQILVKSGAGNLPLWNTETGWFIGNADGSSTDAGFLDSNWKRFESADSDWLVARALLLARGEGVDRFYWYSWDGKAVGLVEPRSSPLKPGAKAYDRVAQWLLGSAIKPCQSKGDVWSCAMFRDGSLAGWVAWQTTGMAQFEWPGSDSHIRIQKLDGSESTSTVKSKQKLTVTARPTFFQISSVTN